MSLLNSAIPSDHTFGMAEFGLFLIFHNIPFLERNRHLAACFFLRSDGCVYAFGDQRQLSIESFLWNLSKILDCLFTRWVHVTHRVIFCFVQTYPSCKKKTQKSLRGSKENFLKRVILNRRRYNKTAGDIKIVMMCYLQRSYYISDDLIYFRQFKRTLEKLP